MGTKPIFDSLQKAELHTHLDGSLRLNTLWELMQTLPEPERPFSDLQALRSAFTQVQHESLVDYLRPFQWTLSVMQSKEAIERVAYELVEDAANEGISILEVRGCPALCQAGGLSLHAVMEATLEGLKRGSVKTGVRVGWIMCALRHHSVDESMLLAQLAVAYRHAGVVGFDLAGPEEGYLPHLHRPAIQLARDAGLGITLHAGEAAGPDSIWDAIEQGATRLGHGCTLLSDTKLIDHVGKHGIVIECCLSSNVQTRAVSSMRQHPLKKFIQLGLKATINTDNRLMSQTTLSKEFEIAQHTIGLSHEELRKTCQYAVEASFVRT